MLVIPVKAEVIFPPLHEHGIDISANGLGEKWNILEKDLFLEVFGACGYDRYFLTQHKGNQICQGFSGARARFQGCRGTMKNGLPDQLRHTQL